MMELAPLHLRRLSATPGHSCTLILIAADPRAGAGRRRSFTAGPDSDGRTICDPGELLRRMPKGSAGHDVAA